MGGIIHDKTVFNALNLYIVVLTVPMSVIRSSMPSASCSATVPIGVFWDIENCTVPFHKSALGLVQKIRDLFFNGCKEADFMCVCDTSHQNKDMIQELNDAQVIQLLVLQNFVLCIP